MSRETRHCSDRSCLVRFINIQRSDDKPIQAGVQQSSREREEAKFLDRDSNGIKHRDDLNSTADVGRRRWCHVPIFVDCPCPLSSTVLAHFRRSNLKVEEYGDNVFPLGKHSGKGLNKAATCGTQRNDKIEETRFDVSKRNGATRSVSEPRSTQQHHLTLFSKDVVAPSLGQLKPLATKEDLTTFSLMRCICGNNLLAVTSEDGGGNGP
ncbi:hypothetical protein OSTOST_05132 [Ostertagia ostertagi]